MINILCISGYIFFSPIAFFLAKKAKKEEEKDVLCILAKFLPATEADRPGCFQRINEKYIKPFLIRDYHNRTDEIEKARHAMNNLQNFNPQKKAMGALMTGFGVKFDPNVKVDKTVEASQNVPLSPRTMDRRKALNSLFANVKK